MKQLLFLLVMLMAGNIESAQAAQIWHTHKSTHFIVYYKSAPEDFLEGLVGKSEDYYNNIAEDLGFRRYDFWLWDNRAKIYIYDDAQEYQAVTGQPAWSSGSVAPKDKVIHSFVGQKGFFDTVLPHEMGHIIFREFVGFDNYAVPLWLDEGVASYQEALRRSIAGRTIKEAVLKGNFINLDKLSQLDPRLMQDSVSVNLFYAEALSIIDYLIKQFSKDRFVLFCQNLRDKRNLEKALALSYGFNNIKELDKSWQEYLRE